MGQADDMCITVAWDQLCIGEKRKKNQRGRKKKIGERTEPRGSLGREKSGGLSN